MHPNPEVSMINKEDVSLFKKFKAGDSATSLPDKAEDPAVTHFTRAGLSYCHLKSILSAMCISSDL